MITDERLKAWFDGDIEDDELTPAEVKELERRVFSAIVQKTLANPGVHTFPDHGTVQ